MVAIFREQADYIESRLHGLAEAQLHASDGQLSVDIVKAFVLAVLNLSETPDGQTFPRLAALGMTEGLEEQRPSTKPQPRPISSPTQRPPRPVLGPSAAWVASMPAPNIAPSGSARAARAYA